MDNIYGYESKKFVNKTIIIFTIFALFSNFVLAKDTVKVPPKEANLIYKAAGFKKNSRGWKSNCGDLEITVYKDLNGDGLRDALISEYGTKCYGNTAQGYYVIQQKKSGIWKQVFHSQGIPDLQKTVGKDNWPDIQNGGPGFCFGVFRWNGKTYQLHRYEYEGKTCHNY